MNRKKILPALGIFLTAIFVGHIFFIKNSNDNHNELSTNIRTIASKFTRKCNELVNSVLFGKKININSEKVKTAAAGQFIIGFMRDKEGLIRPVRSDSNRVRSIRELDGIFAIFGRWITDRRMTEIPLVEFSGNNLKLDLKSQDYDFLPDQLKDIFASGKILITGNNSDRGKSPYSVLMPVAYQSDGVHEGRTGVLLYNGEPVIVKFSGKEFLVELKGVGTPGGGYDYNDSNRFIRGGIIPGHTDLEFRNIEADRLENPRFVEGDSVRAGATLSFDSPKGRQSYLIRFTPGSVRASFRENAGLNIPEGNSVLLAKKMGEIWGDFISRGLIPLTHFENLVALNGYQDYIMTDYSDIAPIGKYPYRDRDKESVTKASLAALSEIPGYKKTQHFPAFREGLVSSLKKSKKFSDATIGKIAELETTNEIATVLWDDYLRLVYFRQRQKIGWIPDSLKYVDLDHVDFSDEFFSETLIDKLKLAYRRNIDEISRIQGRIEENRASLKKQLEELELMKSNPQKWKDQLMAKESWMSDSQAQMQLESRQNQLESSQQGFNDWVKERQGDIENLKNENIGIEGTNFTVEGVLKIIKGDEYINAFKTVIMGIESGHKYYAIDLGNNAQDLLLLRNYLRKEIKFLEGLEKMASKDELAEIQRNLALAKERHEEFASMGPYEFHQRMKSNPEMLLMAYMLPYYSKNLDTSPDMMEQKQYQRYLPMILRLIEEGKI